MALGQRFPAHAASPPERQKRNSNSGRESGRDGDPGLWGYGPALSPVSRLPSPCCDVGLPAKPAASQPR